MIGLLEIHSPYAITQIPMIPTQKVNEAEPFEVAVAHNTWGWCKYCKKDIKNYRLSYKSYDNTQT